MKVKQISFTSYNEGIFYTNIQNCDDFIATYNFLNGPDILYTPCKHSHTLEDNSVYNPIHTTIKQIHIYNRISR